MSLKTSIHTQFLVLLYIDFYTIIISDFAVFVGLYFIKILSIHAIYSSYQQKNPLYKLSLTIDLYILIFHQNYDLF